MYSVSKKWRIIHIVDFTFYELRNFVVAVINFPFMGTFLLVIQRQGILKNLLSFQMTITKKNIHFCDLAIVW